ncbi:MAG: hypothetical protein LC750_17910 [Actinobacteria bacterium]|nr:hypothetical protein [Actinomycetota bacterium]
MTLESSENRERLNELADRMRPNLAHARTLTTLDDVPAEKCRTRCPTDFCKAS